MKQGQHRFISLMSMMTVLWTLGQGCPNEPGPTCAEELPNTVAIINRLKKSLRDLYKSFVDPFRVINFYDQLLADNDHRNALEIPREVFSQDEGYGGRRGPVCTLSNTGVRDLSTDLDTIDTRLCQYTKCFQYLAGTIKEYSMFQTSFKYCQKYLNQLENAIKKMKRQPPASCTGHCRISWSFNDSEWDEVTKGAPLTQELLTYLEELDVSCS